jgi:Tellurite resistance protein TerB
MGKGHDILRWLGIDKQAVEPEVLDSVAAILDRMDERRARYIAAFAYLLGRVAGADHEIGDEDFRRFGGTHNLIVAREFASLATPDERLALLRCLFAVSAADLSVNVGEDNEIRRISQELKIEHADFIRARAEVREHLAVLRRTRA